MCIRDRPSVVRRVLIRFISTANWPSNTLDCFLSFSSSLDFPSKSARSCATSSSDVDGGAGTTTASSFSATTDVLLETSKCVASATGMASLVICLLYTSPSPRDS
eukprot:TRINITY_DN34746_c0_g1_i1.p1 TRINITY_DN34746_c0_g1~~TRINITY_DN34746_c0_g1_i1.p1  ORF type:complete len:105 (+),score=18.56 TRINITY_DN34746_c0_g1_i1:100-414(+)